MRGKPYRPYQGRRWGEMLLWVGVLVLAASAVTFLAAPFSIRKFAAFPALGGLSRQYAKRQLTWFRRREGTQWITWEKEPDFGTARRRSTEFIREAGLG